MTSATSTAPAAAATVARASGRQAPPAILVIFGGAGDLTKRLVVPALYNLLRAGRLADGFSIVGVGRGDVDTQAWRHDLWQMLQSLAADGGGEFRADGIDQDAWDWLARRMTFLSGDFTRPEIYSRLKTFLVEHSTKHGNGNVLFYLAVADKFFGAIIEHLGRAQLTCQTNGHWRRVIIEKPFGHDLASARALNAQILKILGEDQIYRIDHFLGKETVQNILVLRFANGIFEPLWNRDHVCHVEITAAETVGVERRGKFYEGTGALRDMVPNHVMQLLALTAMEPPTSFDADAVRTKRSEVIDAIQPLSPARALRDVVRGQYDAGAVLGAQARAYRQEPDVAPNSSTETFIACKLKIDNWRWAGVPFYLRTGKYMKHRRTEIAIRFHQAPYSLFRGTDVERMNPNWMILRIQPDEGIAFEFAAKLPGPSVKLSNVSMDFAYKTYFKTAPNTGYETLLYDCMIGDATLFQRADNIEAGWQAVQPILDTWANNSPRDFPNYAAGGTGPVAADELLTRDGRAWRPLD